jgi:hypothetical protein
VDTDCPVLVPFEEAWGAVSMLGIDPYLVIGLTSAKSTGQLVLIEKCEEGRSSAKHALPCPAPPLALAASGETLFVGMGREIITGHIVEGTIVLDGKVYGQVPSAVGFLELDENLIWAGDLTEGVFCFSLDAPNPIAVDPEPRAVTAMCVFDRQTVAVGDRYGRICLLRLPRDLARPKIHWRKAKVPDRGIAQPYADCAGRLIRIASFSVDEAVTSITLGPNRNATFYTTLLGQLGAFVRVEDEAEFGLLALAEIHTLKKCRDVFGFTVLRKREPEKLNTVSADILDCLEQLPPNLQHDVETVLRVLKGTLIGIIAKLKSRTKF